MRKTTRSSSKATPVHSEIEEEDEPSVYQQEHAKNKAKSAVSKKTTKTTATLIEERS